MASKKKDEKILAQMEAAFSKFQLEMKEIEKEALKVFKGSGEIKKKKEIQEALDKIRQITAAS